MRNVEVAIRPAILRLVPHVFGNAGPFGIRDLRERLQCRDEEHAARGHLAGDAWVLVEVRAVLDGVDASLDRSRDADGAVRMRRDP